MIRGLFSFALVLLTASFPLAIGAEDEAQALLAKHRSFVGWEFNDGTFRTMRVETIVTRTDKSGKQRQVVKMIDLQRGIVNKLFEYGERSGSVSGFSGSVYWLSDANGFTITRLDDDRKTTLALALLFDEATPMLPATVLRRENLNGTPIVVLRQQVPNGYTLDLSVDPQIGAYKRAVIDAAGSPTQVEIDDYAEVVPGKKTIASYHFTGDSDQYVRTVSPNVSVTDADLHPPADQAKWTFGSGQPFYVDVGETELHVDAVVNGVRGRFILDTGAGGIFLSADFAAKAKVAPLKVSFDASGVAGDVALGMARTNTIEFGDGSTLHDALVATGLRNESWLGDGLIGFDFLARAIVEIDLDAKNMRIYDPEGTPPNTSGGVVVVPDLSELVPVIPAKLNGSVATRAMLDSGNAGSVLLNSELRGRTRTMIDRQKGFEYRVTGVAGRAEDVECGQLDSIDLGALHYLHAPVCFALTQPHDEALLGYDLIRNFNLVFDYPHDKIVMFPRKKYQ